jgi:glucosamine-phosphate N-acetyltransferase
MRDRRFILFLSLFSFLKLSPIFEEKLNINGDYRLRHLHVDDFRKGMCELLGQLTFIGSVEKSSFASFRFKLTPDHIVLVVEDFLQQKIIAAGTLFIEPKLIHSSGYVGHIEDIVTDELARGKGLGKLIVSRLSDYARARGCYKTILDCSEDNVPFYTRCLFHSCGIEMEKR